jgi:hypothetical protein
MARNKDKRKDNKPSAPSALRAETGPRAAVGTPSRADSGPAPATTAQGVLPPFYQQPRPLHLQDHADLCLKSPPTYEFAAKTVAMQIVIGEFLVAARDYPIVFAPGTPPVPVIMLGLRPEENMYVRRDGSWLPGAYVPAYIRRYPFLLGEAGENKRHVLFVDEASPNVTRGQGTPLVADGKPTDAAKNAMKFCEAYNLDQENTRQFCEALAALDLLEKRNINLTLANGNKVAVNDTLAISPRKFEEMSDSLYLEWRKRKWLFTAYCHFHSGMNWQRLIERAAQRAAKK